MAITLGGITCPDLLIDDEFSQTGVDGEVVMSLGGKPLIFEREISGKIIDLVGTVNQAWMARSILSSIFTLASLPHVSYQLSYEGAITTVRFRSENPPVIEATPLIPRPNQAVTDWYYNIKIKLMEM